MKGGRDMVTAIPGGQKEPPIALELPARTKLKRLILQADERELNRILQAIATVTGHSAQ